MAKAPYKTKQMTEILTFLKSVQGRHVTVNEICDFFQGKRDFRRNHDHLPSSGEDGERRSGREVCNRRFEQCLF